MKKKLSTLIREDTKALVHSTKGMADPWNNPAASRTADTEARAAQSEASSERIEAQAARSEARTQRRRERLEEKRFSSNGLKRPLIILLVIILVEFLFLSFGVNNLPSNIRWFIILVMFIVPIYYIFFELNQAGMIPESLKWLARTSVFLVLVGVLLFVLLVFAYGEQAPKCVEHRQPDKVGYEALWADLTSFDFLKCMTKYSWNSFILFVQGFSQTDFIFQLIDQQVYRATGDYYFTKVDQNSKEPIGVFVTVDTSKETYSLDNDFGVTADIEVKTVGDDISGKVFCSLNKIPAINIRPDNGNFVAEESLSKRVDCIFDKDQFSGGPGNVEFQVTYNTGTFAHMAPTVVKTSVYDKLSEVQKKEEIPNAISKALLTTNAPVKIGGKLGTNYPITLIDDERTTVEHIEFGFGINPRNWDEGQLREVRTLTLVFPSYIELTPDQTDEEGNNNNNNEDEIVACLGYTFKKINCEQLGSYLGEDNPTSAELCRAGESQSIYTLDISGDNKNLENIDRPEPFQCRLKSELSELFTEDGQEIGLRIIPTRVYITYEYEVVGKVTKALVKSTVENIQTPVQTTCTNEIHALASQGQQNTDVAGLKNYAQEFQGLIKRIARKHLPTGFSAVEMESLIASIAYEYNNHFPEEIPEELDKDDDGSLDYLSGCQYNDNLLNSDDHADDIECAAQQLKTILTNNQINVEEALQTYYQKAGSDKEDDWLKQYSSEEKRTSAQNYHSWLKTLCKPKEGAETNTGTAQTTDPSVESSIGVQLELPTTLSLQLIEQGWDTIEKIAELTPEQITSQTSILSGKAQEIITNAQKAVNTQQNEESNSSEEESE